MEGVLFACAALAFALSPTLAPLALRCGLSACLRFSPRAAVGLAALSALFGHLGALAARGGLRSVPPGQRLPAALSGIVGGTLGRMALLLFAARFTGSLPLARVQALPLLLLTLLALLPDRLRRLPPPCTPRSFALWGLSAACLSGGLGGGALALFSSAAHTGVRRTSPTSGPLLLSLCAQTGALLLTLLSGGAQVFPARMLAALALGAWVGGRQSQKRGKGRQRLLAALKVYAFLAALSSAEQAFALFTAG